MQLGHGAEMFLCWWRGSDEAATRQRRRSLIGATARAACAMLLGRGDFVDVFGAALEARAFLCDAALAAGHELGVFDALAHKGPATLDQLAGKIGVVAGSHRLRALLEVLAALGAITRE